MLESSVHRDVLASLRRVEGTQQRPVCREEGAGALKVRSGSFGDDAQVLLESGFAFFAAEGHLGTLQ